MRHAAPVRWAHSVLLRHTAGPMMAETELWLVDLGKLRPGLEATEAAEPRLSEDMKVRFDRMADPVSRRERRLAHIALRLALEARVGSEIRRAPFVRNTAGKPSLPGRSCAFSLSHTQGLALIALGREEPLGVDIERMRRVRVPAARRVPIEAEAVALAEGAALSSAGPDAQFLNAWVRIEAAAKAQGCGVGSLLERLRPRHVASPSPSVPPPEAVAPRIVVRDVPVADGVFAAIALSAGLALPPLRHFPEDPAAIEAFLSGEAGTRR